MKALIGFCWYNDTHHVEGLPLVLGQLATRGIKRDKLNGTNGAKFAVFRRFSLILQIFVFPGKYSISEAQLFAENRRFSQKTTGNRRILQKRVLSHLVCPW